jgi:hypothetical protein
VCGEISRCARAHLISAAIEGGTGFAVHAFQRRRLAVAQ